MVLNGYGQYVFPLSHGGGGGPAVVSGIIAVGGYTKLSPPNELSDQIVLKTVMSDGTFENTDFSDVSITDISGLDTYGVSISNTGLITLDEGMASPTGEPMPVIINIKNTNLATVWYIEVA